MQEHEDWYLEDFVLGATKYKQLTKKYDPLILYDPFQKFRMIWYITC